jgi:hypothetical protein
MSPAGLRCNAFSRTSSACTWLFRPN